MTVLSTSWRVVRHGVRVQWSFSRISPLAALSQAVTPVAYGFAVGLADGRLGLPLFVGVVAAGLWGSLMVDPAVIVVNERSWGTLETIATTPTAVWCPLVGRLLGAATLALVVQPLAVLGLLLPLWRASGGTVVVETGGLGLAVAALGTVLCGLFGMSTVVLALLARFRYSAGMVNGLFGVVVLLGGFLAPIGSLPLPLTLAARSLPPSWALSGVRSGEAHEVLVAGGLALVWCGIGLWSMSRVDAGLRRHPEAFRHG